MGQNKLHIGWGIRILLCLELELLGHKLTLAHVDRHTLACCEAVKELGNSFLNVYIFCCMISEILKEIIISFCMFLPHNVGPFSPEIVTCLG